MGNKIISIITAREGSKGIINKNIKPLSGEPLIAWSIKFALENDYISDCIVSTDSYEIAEIAQNYGAEIPDFYIELFKDGSLLQTTFSNPVESNVDVYIKISSIILNAS